MAGSLTLVAAFSDEAPVDLKNCEIVGWFGGGAV